MDLGGLSYGAADRPGTTCARSGVRYWSMIALRTLVVIGNDMVGHRFIEKLVKRGAHRSWQIVTFCEEPRVAYDPPPCVMRAAG